MHVPMMSGTIGTYAIDLGKFWLCLTNSLLRHMQLQRGHNNMRLPSSTHRAPQLSTVVALVGGKTNFKLESKANTSGFCASDQHMLRCKTRWQWFRVAAFHHGGIGGISKEER